MSAADLGVPHGMRGLAERSQRLRRLRRAVRPRDGVRRRRVQALPRRRRRRARVGGDARL